MKNKNKLVTGMNNGSQVVVQGLSKREYFTALVMQGFFTRNGKCTEDRMDLIIETVDTLLTKLEETKDEV